MMIINESYTIHFPKTRMEIFAHNIIDEKRINEVLTQANITYVHLMDSPFKVPLSQSNILAKLQSFLANKSSNESTQKIAAMIRGDVKTALQIKAI